MRLRPRIRLILAAATVWAAAGTSLAQTAVGAAHADASAKAAAPVDTLATPLAGGAALLQRLTAELHGIRYRFGGNLPELGLDCSGLVGVVWSRLGLETPPRTSAALASTGRPVEVADLQPGDLVFFNTRGRRFSHVGIYTGKGRFVHASSVQRRVTEGSLDDHYYRTRFNGARRLATMPWQTAVAGAAALAADALVPEESAPTDARSAPP